MDLRKLKTLIDLVSESGVAELEITEGEDRVRIVNRTSAPAQPVQSTIAIAPQPQAAAAAPAAAAAAAPVEEKTEFDVVMTEFGAEKIKVIKEVRGLLGLGLAEAKAIVEAVPAKLKEAVSKEEGEEIKSKLEAVGAKVELK